MKVAIVIERLGNWRGGAETSTAEYAQLLAARGVDVTIVAGETGDAPPGVRVTALSSGRVASRIAAFARAAAEHLRTASFDVVHAVTPLPEADLYQPRGGLLRETHARNVALRRTPVGRLLKRLLQSASFKHNARLRIEEACLRPDGPIIACVSQYVAEQCRIHYGLIAPRVRVVFNGVNVTPLGEADRVARRAALRKRLDVPADALLGACVAHNFRLKGVGPLIESVARAVGRGTDLRVLVVGRDRAAPYRRLAARLDVAERVIFTGPSADMASIWAASDFCVLPTFYDPCSRVVLEALTLGLPCITTRFNGAAEIMRDGAHGLILGSPADTDSLAAALARMGDPAARARMSAAAVQLGPAVSMERHVGHMLALYEQLVAGRAAARASGAAR